jgi:hypothetical protein
MTREDVEEAVGLIKSTIKVLQQCLAGDRNFVPNDIEEAALKVFQTSSLLPEFNEMFWREKHDACAKANKYGGIANFYQSVQEKCQLASNSHKQLIGAGDEYVWVTKPKQGAHVPQTSTTPNTGKCFNCGKPGCVPSACDQPRDEEKIKTKVNAYKKAHPKSGTANGGNEQQKHEGNGGHRHGKREIMVTP